MRFKLIIKLRLIVLLGCLCSFQSLYSNFSLDSLNFYEKILEMDTLSSENSMIFIEKCIVWSEEHKDVLKKEEFLVKKGEILFDQEKYEESIRYLKRETAIIQKQMPKEKGVLRDKWIKLHVDALNFLGFSLIYHGKESEAIQVFNDLITLYGNDSKTYAEAKAYNGMGVVMAVRKHWKTAESYFNKSLKIYNNLNNAKGIYSASNNLGHVFVEMNNYQNALVYFLEAQKVVIQEDYQGKEVLYIASSLGIAYSGLKKFDLADKYFKDAVEISEEKKLDHVGSIMRIHYATNLMMQKRHQEAKNQVEIVLEKASKSGFIPLQISANQMLAYILIEKKDFKKALEYTNQVVMLKDSFYNVEVGDKLISQRYEFDNYKASQEEKMREQEINLQQLKINKRNWLIMFLILLSVSFFTAYYFLLRNVKKQRLINSIVEEQLHDTEVISQMKLENREKELGDEIENKAKELTSNAILSQKFNELALIILKKVKQLKIEFTIRPKERKMVEEIENLLKDFTPGKDWDEFKLYFEQVDRGFFIRLNKEYPNLTPNEKRLCALIHLQLNSKEIAMLTNRTFQSVATAKTRLKKKMNLLPDINLYEIFHNFS